MLEIYVLQVLALHLDGQTDQAMHLLAHLLTVAEPEGYIRLFVDEGEALRQAIAECNTRNPQWPSSLRYYVAQLLRAFTTISKSVVGQDIGNGGALLSLPKESLGPSGKRPH